MGNKGTCLACPKTSPGSSLLSSVEPLGQTNTKLRKQHSKNWWVAEQLKGIGKGSVFALFPLSSLLAQSRLVRKRR
jgi:hypothetical protein